VLVLLGDDSYRHFVDVGAEFVVWNVVVAPEFSLQPVPSCFPVIGCVAYRGYFSEADARAYAEGWRHRGYDVAVSGVRAYSTLGWLPDPVFSTMLSGSELYLAAVIFHERAHQVVYIPDDTDFNEGFAVAVEQAGVRRWLDSLGREKARGVYDRWLLRQRAVARLIARTRRRLIRLYSGTSGRAAMRAAKRAALRDLVAAYRDRVRQWGGTGPYDAWFAEGIDNARLALFSTYFAKVPAFLCILEEEGGDFGRFIARVRQLSLRSRGEREAALAGGIGTRCRKGGQYHDRS